MKKALDKSGTVYAQTNKDNYLEKMSKDPSSRFFKQKAIDSDFVNEVKELRPEWFGPSIVSGLARTAAGFDATLLKVFTDKGKFIGYTGMARRGSVVFKDVNWTAEGKAYLGERKSTNVPCLNINTKDIVPF